MAKTKHQYATPLFINAIENCTKAIELKSVEQPDETKERWLQELIFRHSHLLPVAEVERAFGALIPVCRELPVGRGRVDNFYMTADGKLALAECKLWRNAESRRKVVAQILEYADKMSDWSYEDLERAVSKGKEFDGTGLYSFVSAVTGDDDRESEQHFQDSVSQHLRHGEILLLVVGDGIREGVESLARLLQKHAGFRFQFGMIALELFELPVGGYVVQPRLLVRTQNIERGVVTFKDGRFKIEPVAEDAPPRTMSEAQMFDELARKAPELADKLKAFEQAADTLGVFIEGAPKSLQLRWTGTNDIDYALGGVTPDGKLKTKSVNGMPNEIDKVELAHEYLEKIATLLDTRVRRTESPNSWYVEGKTQKFPDAIDLLSKQTEWLDIIRWYTGELSSAIEATSE
jgi:hypothetical protein